MEERQGPFSGFGITGDSCDKQNSMSFGAISFLNDVLEVCAGFEVLIIASSALNHGFFIINYDCFSV